MTVNYFLFVQLPGDKSRIHVKEHVIPLTSSLAPPVSITANKWLIINSSDVSVCNQIASEFSQWNLLFVTTNLLPANREYYACIFITSCILLQWHI